MLPTHFVGNLLASHTFLVFFCRTILNVSALFQVLKMTEDLQLSSNNCDIMNLQHGMVVQGK